MGVRPKTLPFTYEGKTYILRCNMNVLADVQEINGGKISPALSGARGMKNALMFLAAMMNDYADEQCWPDRFTWRELGRVLLPKQVPSSDIIGLVLDALAARETADAGTPAENETGN